MDIILHGLGWSCTGIVAKDILQGLGWSYTGIVAKDILQGLGWSYSGIVAKDIIIPGCGAIIRISRLVQV